MPEQNAKGVMFFLGTEEWNTIFLEMDKIIPLEIHKIIEDDTFNIEAKHTITIE